MGLALILGRSPSSKIVVSGSESRDQIGKRYRRAGHDRRDADFCQFSSDYCRSSGGQELGGEVSAMINF